MKTLKELVETNDFLKENKTKAVFVLRRISLSYSDLDKDLEEVVQRIAYKNVSHKVDKDFIYKVIACLPEKSVQTAVRKRHYQILKMHRELVSEKINKELAIIFADLKKEKKEEYIPSQLDMISDDPRSQIALYFNSKEFLDKKAALNA